ncbi:glycosyltransferase [Providencia rettgeri]
MIKHKNIEILFISHSDKLGGAARACFRLNKAFIKNQYNAKTFVQIKKSDESFVLGPSSKLGIMWGILRSKLGQLLIRIFIKKKSKTINSLNIYPSSMLHRINSSSADIVNLHWINGETISIKQIAKISKPTVMTLHDMWALCGTEHVLSDDMFESFKKDQTYTNNNYRLFNFDYFTWKRKKKLWNNNLTIVTPSSWLANCAKQSAIFHNASIQVIPNPIDTNLFKPIDKTVARKILNLPQEKKLIGFGSWKGDKDPNKGYDLLIDTLDHIANCSNNDGYNIECVIFGSSDKKDNLKLDTHYLGHLNDEYSLALLYNALDMIIVPSRIENLPQVATESLSCGCPVAGFNTAGMPDTIEHMKTGYLAAPYNTEELASGIINILMNNDLRKVMSKNARENALSNWSEDVVTRKYSELFNKLAK